VLSVPETDPLLLEARKTHPWITFELDLRDAPPDLWVALGEAKAATEFIANMPIVPELARQLHKVFLAKGALATTAIEGNTLTEEEALAQIEGQLRLPPSQAYLAREIQNVVDACNAISEELARLGPQPLTPERIRQFNALVLKDVPAAEGAVPGQYREHLVGVGGRTYVAVPARLVPGLMERLCAWLNGPEWEAPREELRTPFAILRAVAAHLYIAWIHPFGDGNGRTARLVELFLLMSSGFPTLTTHLMSNHYNATRSEYYRHLDLARKDPVVFLTYAARGFADQLQQQVSTIQGQQIAIVWENFTHKQMQMRGLSQDVARRRQALLVALAYKGGSVPRSDLTNLSPELARLYAMKTRKTLSRDLNALQAQGLIVRDQHGRVKANIDVLRQFMPQRIRDKRAAR